MRFEFPWAFVILLAIPAMLWYSRRRKTEGALRFSSVKHARDAGASWRTRLRHLPLLIRCLAVILLTIGLARPQQGREEVRDVSKGIALEVVLDRSGSMGQEFVYEGAHVNRLDVVKKIFREFVLGNRKDLKGRPNDLVGMVSFARYAETVCPLTLSHGALDLFIQSIHLAKTKAEDGTAIGDALALAAARLRTAEEQLKRASGKWGGRGLKPASGGAMDEAGTGSSEAEKSLPGFTSGLMPFDKGYEIKSKVIILLTDGQNNAGKRSPEEAARLAREWGIKVYAIGIGGREAFMTMQTPMGEFKVPAGPGVDEATLKTIATETGGAYWMAESADKLRDIYKEIDKMERTEIESMRYVDYSERFLPFALAALLALCLEQILVGTVLRRIP